MQSEEHPVPGYRAPAKSQDSVGAPPEGHVAVPLRAPRVTLLLQLQDRPGALQRALKVFSDNQVNLTQIESRPAKNQRFDFYVDCEGQRGDRDIDAVIAALDGVAVKLLVLDHREVPWFPRQIEELDLIANNTLDAGTDLEADHPGFSDPEYRTRRANIDALARAHCQGQQIADVEYSAAEHDTWRTVYERLRVLHEQFACRQYRQILAELEQHCGYGDGQIPQARTINDYLQATTGFALRPVAGLLSSRDFLNGLAFRVFFCTQYIRHHSKPLYTPEPDVCHELIGHAPMFADPAFAELSAEIGLASLGASDAQIERLARCYWHSVEFGLVRESGTLKAYGAGLLSSFGELEYACSESLDGVPELREWDPAAAALQDFPITEYQPVYFVAPSLRSAREQMRSYCESLPRPFHAKLNSASSTIWVDRAVRRASSQTGPT
ncbi:MAG: ACT domain-containing protein [Pseudomonadales bacterium]